MLLLDSLTRPPILRGVSMREKVRFAQMNHRPVSRRIWLSDDEFAKIWGNRTETAKRKCVGNTTGMYRIAGATLNMDFLAYAKALLSEEPGAHLAAQAVDT